MSIVEIRGLKKIYHSKSNLEVCALDSIDIKIEKGEFIAIVGPSGSGKSTLLHLLGGLDKPTEGVIRVNDRNLDDLSDDDLAEYRRCDVGIVFQKFNLIPILTTIENILLPMEIENDEVDKEYLEEVLKLLKLEDRLKHTPNELSGGQQQRVSIARALIAKPSIILADEPTGNLDYKTSEEIVNYFQLLSDRFKQTIIMITHDRELAKRAHRILEINDGKVSNTC